MSLTAYDEYGKKIPAAFVAKFFFTDSLICQKMRRYSARLWKRSKGMIEIVYKDEKQRTEDKTVESLPKNIRQIGEPDSRLRVYM